MAGDEIKATDDKNTAGDDTYDELSSVLAGKDVPGSDLTGEPDDKSGEEEDKSSKEEDKLGETGDKGTEDKSTEDKGDKTVDAGKKEPLEVDSLRTELRETRRQLAIMQAKLSRLGRQKATPAKKEDEDEEDLEEQSRKGKEEEEEEELSEIEVYEEELSSLAETRGQALGDMLTMMALNPKTEDVEEVCTRQRFDDIFEAAAQDMVEKEGGDVATAQLAIELNVWKKSNPYAYMYGIIKKYHPDYKKAEDDAGGDADKDKDKDKSTSTDKGKEQEPAKSPVSALDLGRGGGDKNMGEWTAEKIDNLPEHELDKVPKDVYNKYLRGDLDK